MCVYVHVHVVCVHACVWRVHVWHVHVCCVCSRMSVMCACMYACAYVYRCACVACVCVRMRVHMCACMYVCVHVSKVYVCVMGACVCTPTYACSVKLKDMASASSVWWTRP